MAKKPMRAHNPAPLGKCGCKAPLLEVSAGIVCSKSGRDCALLPKKYKAHLQPLTADMLQGLPYRQARRAHGQSLAEARERRFQENHAAAD